MFAVSDIFWVGISFRVGLWMATIIGIGVVELGIGKDWRISGLFNGGLIDDCVFAFVGGDVVDDPFVFGGEQVPSDVL